MKVNWNRVISSLGMTGPYLGAPGLPNEVRINLLRSTHADQSQDVTGRTNQADAASHGESA